MRLYLLYGGESEDGRGQGEFKKVAMSADEARQWFKGIEANPWSTGKVQILTGTTLEVARRLEDII